MSDLEGVHVPIQQNSCVNVKKEDMVYTIHNPTVISWQLQLHTKVALITSSVRIPQSTNPCIYKLY